MALSRTAVADLFLKRSVTWDNGEPVQPVEQAQSSDVREAFSLSVLGLPVSRAVREQAAANGDPIPSMATDRDVLAYVRLKPGAIGYVSTSASVAGVKVLRLDHATAPVQTRHERAAPLTLYPPVKVRDVKPEYPQTARAAHVRGSVDIEILIGTTGDVEEARVVRSSPLFDAAALEAVKQWRYAPTLLNSRPLPVRMVVHVTFAP